MTARALKPWFRPAGSRLWQQTPILRLLVATVTSLALLGAVLAVSAAGHTEPHATAGDAWSQATPGGPPAVAGLWQAAPDLTITKNAPVTVTAGASIVYTVTVRNIGTATADNVRMVDVLPVGLVDGTIDIFWPGCTAGTPGDPQDPLVCQLGNMSAGGAVTVTFQATVDPSFVADQPNAPFADTLRNDAFVESDTPDSDTSQNRVNTETRVVASAELMIAKAGNPATVTAGEALSYELAVANTGPSTAEEVVVTDTLPSAVTFQSAAVVNGAGGETCAYAAGQHVVACTLGTLRPQATPRIRIEVLVKPGTPAGTITNTARVVSLRTTDPGSPLFPNTSTLNTTVITQADLKIEKTSDPDRTFNREEVEKALGISDFRFEISDWADSGAESDIRNHTSEIRNLEPDAPDEVYPGDPVKYTLTVTNQGPSDAQSVVVTDALPGQVVYEIDSGGCVESGGVVTCSLGKIVAGASRSFNVWVRVNAGTPQGTVITNTATVTSTTSDPDSQDNTATERTLIGPASDLAVVKTGSPTAMAGQSITYTLQIVNNGSLAATNATLYDRLPAGVTNVRVTVEPSGPRCTTGTPGNPADPMRCGLGTLSYGGGVTVTIDADVLNSVATGTVLENDAWLTSSVVDADNSNNQDNHLTTVVAAADLVVSKAGPPTVERVANLLYTLTVTNQGPATAVNVRVWDDLPVDGWACATFVTSPVDAVDIQKLASKWRQPVTGVRSGYDLDGDRETTVADIMLLVARWGSDCGSIAIVSAPPECILVGSTLVTCDLGDLSAGQQRTLFITAQTRRNPPKDVLLTNRAEAFSDTADPNAPSAAISSAVVIR